MSGCCDSDYSIKNREQKKVLWILLAINGGMFFVELVSGILANSAALLADSTDMFADAFVYGVSLMVVGKSDFHKARVSILKGCLMICLALFATFEAVSKYFTEISPSVEIMANVGLLALVANLICAYLLLRHRKDDINMRSTWICSRNDVIANVGILIGAGFVSVTGSYLPDAIIGLAIAALIFKSSYGIFIESRVALSLR